MSDTNKPLTDEQHRVFAAMVPLLEREFGYCSPDMMHTVAGMVRRACNVSEQERLDWLRAIAEKDHPENLKAIVRFVIENVPVIVAELEAANKPTTH